MSKVAIVYHSGFGHTQALAEAVAKGVQTVPGATASLVPVAEAEASAAWNGDKHNTLYQLLTLALQHGMVWVGLGIPPGFNHSKGSADDLNRLGASVGAMAQANADQGIEGIAASDFRTMEALGKRVAEAAVRWQEAPLAQAA